MTAEQQEYCLTEWKSCFDLYGRLLLADLPASTAKKLPRYPTVPAVGMGRLAVDQAWRQLGRPR